MVPAMLGYEAQTLSALSRTDLGDVFNMFGSKNGFCASIELENQGVPSLA
jgi:hypothetical protein